MRIQLITPFILTLLLATASLPAAAPTSRPGATAHFTEGDHDFTLTSAPDGHLTLLAKTLTGQLLYYGPYTTPLERAEVPQALQRTFRLAQVRKALGMPAQDEWSILAPRIARIIQDQAWLELDVQAVPLVFTQPKLSDPDNPLTAPAQILAAMLDADNPTADSDLKVALAAFRDARRKLMDTLAADQKALFQISTIRQEANFVRLGILN